MTELSWLMLANGALWLGFGIYIAFLARTQYQLKQRVAQWEENNHG